MQFKIKMKISASWQGMGKNDLQQFSRDDKIEDIKENLDTSSQFEIFIRCIHYFFFIEKSIGKRN